jgi:hypothetical protein
MTTPTTKAGRRLLAMHANCAPMTACTMHGDLPQAVLAIEDDARAQVWAERNDADADENASGYADGVAFARADLAAALVARVETMIEQAGGRCVRPTDYDPDEVNICEAHSEVMLDDECEDQPRQLLAVLAVIREDPAA